MKPEGLGFSLAEIVKELSLKCACSRRTVYNDFESRESWQPIVQSVIDARSVLLKVVNRYEQIYRQASIRLLTASNELAQLGALNAIYSEELSKRDLNMYVTARKTKWLYIGTKVV